MFRRSLVLSLALLFIVTLIAGCKGCKNRRKLRRQNEALYAQQRYTDYILDSTLILQELERDTTLSDFAEDVNDFYQRRNYQAAWLSDGGLSISAYDFLNTLRAYEADFGDSSLGRGLAEAEIGEMLFMGATEKKALLDLKLTTTFFRYAEKAYGGTRVDLKDLEWYIPRMKKDYKRLLDSLVSSPSQYAEYEPVNDYYKALKKALVQYRAIEKKGGWPIIPPVTKLPMKAGDTSAATVILKDHLTLTGDYIVPDQSATYTDTLAAAVRRYQERVGLRPTGRVDSLTLAELNTPVSARIREIMLNMERLRWLPDSTPANYILVNIPEYRLHVYEDHKVAWNMDVVVGNTATATSIFTGRLSVVEFSPYWNVPQSIIGKELLPKLRKDPGYLSRANMEVVRNGEVVDPDDIRWSKYDKTVPFVIRQRPGNDNSLGLVAFFFPNSFDIFLHDTPAKSFFSENSRAFSHGCIRLSQPERLADYLFRADSVRMPPDTIHALMHRHIEKKVPVRPSVPVYIVYFTAWVDQDGLVNFRHDIYGHDARLSKEIFGR